MPRKLIKSVTLDLDREPCYVVEDTYLNKDLAGVPHQTSARFETLSEAEEHLDYLYARHLERGRNATIEIWHRSPGIQEAT